MVKVLKSWNLWNWRGLILGLAQTAIIALVVWVYASFSAISHGAMAGNESLRKMENVEQQIDSLKRCENTQETVNARMDTDMKWIKESLVRIEQKIDRK